MKRPAHYAAPLRQRAAIIAFLLRHEARNRGYSPLAWDVKARGVDLSFDNLIAVYRESGEYGPDDRWLDFPEFLTPARAKFKQVEYDLFDFAVEDARRQVEDGDQSLFDGTPLNVVYGFEGRSGGWLIVREWEGVDLTRMDQDDFEEYLTEMDYAELRRLYKMVVQNDHDFARKQVEREIEYHAAFTFIENICADIPHPDKTQAELPLTV